MASAALQAKLDSLRKRLKVPGVSVGIQHGDREILATSGVTSVDNPLAVTPDTLFMIGSTSKTFTATTVMRLVEQGKLSLQDRVLKYLPDFRIKDKKATEVLTIEHLLTHTGGWDGDAIGEPLDWGDDALRRSVEGLRKQPQVTPVGEVWSYNNTGFAVAGRIIEVVTGKTFEQAVQELLFKPLGMDNTFYSPLDVLTRRFAVGHRSTPKGPVNAHSWGIGREGGPAGAIVSTARDQMAWARFHMGDGTALGKRVTRKSTLHEMQRPHHPAGSMADYVGICWLLSDVGGERIVAHGGNVSLLQVSVFMMVPKRGFAMTVLTNSGSGGLLGAQLQEWALEHYLGIRREAPKVTKVTPAELADYAGSYESALFKLEVSPDGDGLTLTQRWNINERDVPEAERQVVRELMKQPATVQKIGLFAPDRAVVTQGPGKGTRGEFVRRRPNGPVTWLRWGGRLAKRA